MAISLIVIMIRQLITIILEIDLLIVLTFKPATSCQSRVEKHLRHLAVFTLLLTWAINWLAEK